MPAPAGVQEESESIPGLHSMLQRPQEAASRLEKLRRLPGGDPWMLVLAVLAGAGAGAVQLMPKTRGKMTCSEDFEIE